MSAIEAVNYWADAAWKAQERVRELETVLDKMADRLRADPDWDNASSLLESLSDSLEATGRVVYAVDSDDDDEDEDESE